MRLLSLPVAFLALAAASKISAKSLRDTIDADDLARRALGGSMNQKGFVVRRRSLKQHHDLISERQDEGDDDVADSIFSAARAASSASETSTRSATSSRSTSTRRRNTRSSSSVSTSASPTASVDDGEAGISSSSAAALSSMNRAAASSSRAAARLASLSASSASAASRSSASVASASSRSLASVSSAAAADASSSLSAAASASASSAASASAASVASALSASAASASAESAASAASESAARAASATSAAVAAAASQSVQDAIAASASEASRTPLLITSSVDGGYTVITSYEMAQPTGGVTTSLNEESSTSSQTSLSKGAIVAIAVSLGSIMLIAVVFTIIRKRRQALSSAIRPLSFDPTPNYGAASDAHSTHRGVTRTSQESWLGGRPMSGISERDADVLPPMTETNHGNRVLSDGYYPGSSGGYAVGGFTAAQHPYAPQNQYSGANAGYTHYDGSAPAVYQNTATRGYDAPNYPRAAGAEVSGYADLQRGPSSSGHSNGSYGHRAYGVAYGGSDRPEDDPFQYPSSSSRDAMGTTRWSG